MVIFRLTGPQTEINKNNYQKMEHKNDFLLASSMFLTWLSAITTNQIIGTLTVIVLILTAYNRYLDNKKKGLEIKRLEKLN